MHCTISPSTISCGRSPQDLATANILKDTVLQYIQRNWDTTKSRSNITIIVSNCIIQPVPSHRLQLVRIHPKGRPRVHTFRLPFARASVFRKCWVSLYCRDNCSLRSRISFCRAWFLFLKLAMTLSFSLILES